MELTFVPEELDQDNLNYLYNLDVGDKFINCDTDTGEDILVEVTGRLDVHKKLGFSMNVRTIEE